MVDKTAHNLASKIKYQTRRALKKRMDATAQPALIQRAAFLGDNTGVLFTYNGSPLPGGYVVVRDMKGNLSVAFNQRVPNVANSPVNVGYDPLAPTLFQVLSSRDYLDQQPIVSVPAHHDSHEWPGGADVVNVRGEQILPALARGNNGMLVSVYPTFYPKSTGGWGFFGANADGTIQTIDTTSSRPATGAQAFMISIKDNGTLAITSGTTQATPELITAADFPAVPDATYHPVCAVRLYSGQTVINQGQTGTTTTPDIYDLRWLPFGTGSGGGGSPVAGDGIAVAGSTVSSKIDNGTAQTTMADADEIGLWNAAAAAFRKITWANFKLAISNYIATTLSNAIPLMNRLLGDSGTSTGISRDDHIHPTDVTRLGFGSPAGGDLSGTLPKPTVAKIQNVAVATGTPSDGQVLTYVVADGKWEAQDADRFVVAKSACRLGTTGALPSNVYSNGVLGVGATLTGLATGQITIDGTIPAVGDRILVKDEAAQANNGIYVVTVNALGFVYVLTRSLDMDQGNEVPGAMTVVEQGTVNAGSLWAVLGTGPYTMGTTAIIWSQINGAADITAGAGLTKSGNTISANLGSATPQMDGAGAAGTANNESREDHVHPSDTSRVPSTRNINTTAPITGGGNLSADRTIAISVATESAAGSMSASDKGALNVLKDLNWN